MDLQTGTCSKAFGNGFLLRLPPKKRQEPTSNANNRQARENGDQNSRPVIALTRSPYGE
jgi:hypothetical protein